MKKLLFILVVLLLSSSAFSQVSAPKGVKFGKKTTNIIDSVSNVGGKAKFYRGGILLTPYTVDTGYVGDFAILKADTNYIKSGQYVTPYDFKFQPVQNRTIKSYNELGAGIKAVTMGLDFASITGTNLTDDQLVLNMVDILDSTVCIGVKFIVQTAFAGTAGPFNGMALYKIAGTTYTRVAETANTATLYDVAGIKSVAFTTPYTAAPGKYYIALIWGNTALTTSPQLNFTQFSQYWSDWLGNGNKVAATLAAQTSFPASITGAAVSRSQTLFFLTIY